MVKEENHKTKLGTQIQDKGRKKRKKTSKKGKEQNNVRRKQKK
jgi:hypothetical protein